MALAVIRAWLPSFAGKPQYVAAGGVELSSETEQAGVVDMQAPNRVTATRSLKAVCTLTRSMTTVFA